ncbi:MAG: polymer-forming cytoskeletal protein [Rhodospirillaceae bacterium]|nr:polymer-forming cytoskeletal protein [Rhodospirillaceae bacterium]
MTMFGKNKDNNSGNPSSGNAADSVATHSADNKSDKNISAPPLKPFSKKGSHAPAKSTGTPFRGEIPRRVTEIPGGPKRSDHMLALDDEANRLTVGRNICLNGEITACEKLVVDGRVEATLTDAHAIEVSPTGFFKGNADVMEAEISGKFEGTLVAKDLLTIHKDGRVDGSVRYGRIVIEAGGEISGDMASLDEADNNSDSEIDNTSGADGSS